MLQLRLNDSRSKIHTPSVYLDIEHSEAQVKELGSDAKDLQKCSIVRYAHGNGFKVEIATRNLNNIGYAKSYGGMQNDPERLRRLINRVEFTQSLATIAVLEQKDVARANTALVGELQEMAPASKIRFSGKNNNVSKLVKKESVSLLLTWFAVKEDPNKKT
jgi:hypothetical protein